MLRVCLGVCPLPLLFFLPVSVSACLCLSRFLPFTSAVFSRCGCVCVCMSVYVSLSVLCFPPLLFFLLAAVSAFLHVCVCVSVCLCVCVYPLLLTSLRLCLCVCMSVSALYYIVPTCAVSPRCGCGSAMARGTNKVTCHQFDVISCSFLSTIYVERVFKLVLPQL